MSIDYTGNLGLVYLSNVLLENTVCSQASSLPGHKDTSLFLTRKQRMDQNSEKAHYILPYPLHLSIKCHETVQLIEPPKHTT